MLQIALLIDGGTHDYRRRRRLRTFFPTGPKAIGESTNQTNYFNL